MVLGAKSSTGPSVLSQYLTSLSPYQHPHKKTLCLPPDAGATSLLSTNEAAGPTQGPSDSCSEHVY